MLVLWLNATICPKNLENNLVLADLADLLKNPSFFPELGSVLVGVAFY
jgi:hypothetical protein